MNPSTFSGSFLLSSAAASAGSRQSSTCRIIDILDFFFVAHPDSGRTEGQESRRIFYYNSPKSESLEKQTQITGFAEAVINFTDNFSEKRDESEFSHRFVHTANQLHVYLLVESAKFIIGVGLNRDLSTKENYCLRTSAVKAILITAYKMFRLFFGPFSRLMSNDPTHLKDRLEYFFSRYLPQLRLHRMILLDLFCGVDFLSLDSTNYLRIGNFLDQLVEQFPQISKTAFFYRERLISYDVSKTDLPVIFRYLTQNLLSRSLKEELQPEKVRRKISSHHGKFLTGSMVSTSISSVTDKCDAKLPVVYLCEDNNERRLVPYELIVYRALNATVCMFAQKDVDAEFLQKLDDYLGPELSALASLIGESYSTLNEDSLVKEKEFHFVYFNPESLSLKTSFVEDTDSNRNQNLPPLPSSLYKLACDTFEEFLEKRDFGETSTKLEGDWWLVIKVVNRRFLLLILKSSTLTTPADVQQHANNIIKVNFDTIFLF